MHENMNDNELLFLINENDEIAFETLIKRYETIINNVINKYKNKAINIGLEVKDLRQEGLVGLTTAVKTFSETKEASFRTYANILIERTIQDLIKSHDRIKYRSLNSAISLDTFSEEEQQSLYDVIDRNEIAPELKMIDLENRKEIVKLLTPFELKVYELKLDGKTNKEMSSILEKNQRSIENTVQRIKTKLKLNE
ncbi:MAG: sigma-70 family RNA polymerase sigma factor [Bacilli bacterium]|nr:sigma-70 family RNA polymerase sigma factor [Bacilli bacterium]